MTSCVADTHALIWYLFALPELSHIAKAFLDEVADSGGSIFVPTISIVEITYLSEKNRLANNVLPRVISAIQTPNGAVVPVNLSYAISQSLASIPRAIVPDMSRPHYFRDRSAFGSAARYTRPNDFSIDRD